MGIFAAALQMKYEKMGSIACYFNKVVLRHSLISCLFHQLQPLPAPPLASGILTKINNWALLGHKDLSGCHPILPTQD